MENLKVIQYYCYPHLKAPKSLYLDMDEEIKHLLLDATAEFIINVRLKHNQPFEKWSNHQKVWDFFLKK